MGGEYIMKNKKWQRTWLIWRNTGQQEPDWKTNLKPVKPSYKDEVYWMKKTHAIQVLDGYALIGFEITGTPDSRCRNEIIKRIESISVRRLFFKVSTDCNRSFKISFRPNGSFCDAVVDFVTELMKVLGIDLYWLKDFSLGTETYYYHEHLAGSGYISYDQFFKIKRGFIDLTQAPGLLYKTVPTLDPLS